MSNAPITELANPTDSRCAKPWTHLFVSNDGRQLPCCFAQGSPIDAGQIGAGEGQLRRLTDLWNSPFIRGIRLQMIRGERPLICSSCYVAEDAGYRSPRQDANAIYPATIMEELVRTTGADGSVSSGCRSIDVRLGNNCNLRCRMCSPHSSRKLIPEWSKTGHPEMARIATAAVGQQPWGTKSDVWSWVREAGDDLESIHFAGGEPTLIGEHQAFLRNLIASGHARKIRLSYSTNLTRMMPNLEEFAGYFKAINMIGSLDAFGALNTYIRFPARWEQVISTLTALDQLATRNARVSVDLHTTVQAYNLTRLTELLQFLQTTGFQNVPVVPDFAVVTLPAHLNPRVLSPFLKEMARHRFSLFMAERATRPSEPLAFRTLEELRLDQLGKILDAAVAASAPNDTVDFLWATRWFDEERKQRITDVAPEFEDMFRGPVEAPPKG